MAILFPKFEYFSDVYFIEYISYAFNMNFFTLFYVHGLYIWSFDYFPYISYAYIVLLIYFVIVRVY